jgi:hypothetical protein
MPSSSKKQHNFMEAIAHNKAFAKKVGVPQSVGRDFSNADKGKTFKKGGDTMASKMDPRMMAAMMAARKPQMPVGGRMGMDNQMGQAGRPMPGTPAMPMKKGGMAHKDVKEDMPMMKKVADVEANKVVKKHEKKMHGMKAGGSFRSAANGVAKKGLTKGTMIKMKNGGAC